MRGFPNIRRFTPKLFHQIRHHAVVNLDLLSLEAAYIHYESGSQQEMFRCEKNYQQVTPMDSIYEAGWGAAWQFNNNKHKNFVTFCSMMG